MEQPKVTPEMEEKAKAVLESIQKILDENKCAITSQLVYSPDGVTSKAILAFNEEEEKPAEEKND